jgi:hypothetical protein
MGTGGNPRGTLIETGAPIGLALTGALQPHVCINHARKIANPMLPRRLALDGINGIECQIRLGLPNSICLDCLKMPTAPL